MRIAFFTGENWPQNERFLHQYAHVANEFDDVRVVAVGRQKKSRRSVLRRYWRKSRRLGLRQTLEILTSMPVCSRLRGQDHRETDRRLRDLPRPPRKPDPTRVIYTKSTNGPSAVRTFEGIRPDVIIQSGAGVLRSCVFSLARLGALNIHTGIGPLIKGMDSPYWALWERKPEWLGATLHWIDEGIDTGAVLAYAPARRRPPYEDLPSLVASVEDQAVRQLVHSLHRLAHGETWTVTPPDGEHHYRSTFSGWKHLALRRDRKARIASLTVGGPEETNDHRTPQDGSDQRCPFVPGSLS